MHSLGFSINVDDYNVRLCLLSDYICFAFIRRVAYKQTANEMIKMWCFPNYEMREEMNKMRFSKT